MKNMFIFGLALALVASGAFAGDSADKTAQCPYSKKAGKDGADGKPAHCPAGMKDGKSCICFGTIDAVDAKAGTISVKDADGKVSTFTIGAGCKLGKGGKDCAIADLAVGDSVTLKCEGPADKPVVKSVTVKDKNCKKDKKAKKEWSKQ